MIYSPEHILIESTQAGIFVANCDLERLRLLRQTDDSRGFPGKKHCKPGIFKQWHRPALHGQALAKIAGKLSSSTTANGQASLTKSKQKSDAV